MSKATDSVTHLSFTLDAAPAGLRRSGGVDGPSDAGRRGDGARGPQAGVGGLRSDAGARSADEPHDGSARLTGDLVQAINRFPDDNPNPVMRYDADGHLIYANPASAPVLRALGVSVGDRLPAEAIARFDAVAPERGFVELTWQSRTYAVWPVPIRDLDFTNLYGTDVTAERAIVKFPDQNPNPVMRIRLGRHAGVRQPGQCGSGGRDWTSHSAARCRRTWPRSSCDRVRAADRGTVEVEAAGRSYALLPVDVPEFGFINVYGTDVTAVRERERLARRERAAAAQRPARVPSRAAARG